ncbi:unnamed protein product [Orchesella dallaii]|uniref:Pre-mRNA-processing factor 39 n=1 Tax=Orchesella dallaii TaxID=48710 RepID=A0ABP1QV04_9HEXA
MMPSEDSTQDSETSQNMGSVNGGTEEAYYAQPGDDSQSSELPGSKLEDARDGMYSMQDYYTQMQFPNSGVAMAGLDSDSNSRGFAPEDQSAYAEMMMQMQQGEESNNTRDSSESEKLESVTGNGSVTAEVIAEGQPLSMEGSESEQSGKRKLAEVEGSESPDASNVADGSNSSDSPVGPTPAKKALLEINIRKLLPDLEKHWKPVEDDPNDFQAWTYLLQYVDQENELLAAREAYDSFLSRYPYCYGYWKKYADYEKRKGSAEDCEQVFRRGLAAISLSVDLWIHYLNYCKAAHEQQPDYIRGQYEAATQACGLEFRSDKLWEHYLQWEQELNELKNVMSVSDKINSTPTQKYLEHFQSLKDFVGKHPPEDILSLEEYTELKTLVQSEAPEELEGDELVEKIREKIIEKRTLAHKANEAEITARWSFEEAIKRPYFHVKPLEKGQLKMWKEYLDFEIEKGDLARVVTLFERCLIACALYEEYWIRYVKFLQSQLKQSDVSDRLRDVYNRACTIHHQNKPWINLHWAAFEESQGSIDKAVEVLERLMKTLPDSIHAVYRLVNVERRRGNLERCSELFENFISQAKNKADGAHITIKYAHFLAKVM